MEGSARGPTTDDPAVLERQAAPEGGRGRPPARAAERKAAHNSGGGEAGRRGGRPRRRTGKAGRRTGDPAGRCGRARCRPGRRQEGPRPCPGGRAEGGARRPLCRPKGSRALPRKILWGDGRLSVGRLGSGHQDQEAPHGCDTLDAVPDGHGSGDAVRGAGAEPLDVARGGALTSWRQGQPAPAGGRRHRGPARADHAQACAGGGEAGSAHARRLLLRGGLRRLLAAPLAVRPRHREPGAGCGQHPGEPPRAARQDGPARRRRAAAHADGAGARRDAGLPRRARTKPGAGRREAAIAGARQARGRAGPAHEPRQGPADDAGHPRFRADTERLASAARGAAHA